MRRHLVALLLLLCIHGGREAEAAAGGGFVRAQGTRFVMNGSPYYANGFNAYWLMTMAADPAQKGKVTSALSQAAARGLSVARTWAFSDGGSNAYALQYSPGKYNENTFKVQILPPHFAPCFLDSYFSYIVCSWGACLLV